MFSTNELPRPRSTEPYPEPGANSGLTEAAPKRWFFNGLFCRLGHAFIFATIASPFVGCGTKKLPNVVEYRQITAEARSAVQAALESLERVSAHAAHCPPKIVTAFSRDVQRLEVDSIRLRAHAQAILARGDAYFSAWSESIARIKDPRVRELAERFHAQLEESFSKIKLASKEAGVAFKPFLSGLRELRLNLETKSGGIDTDPARELIRNTRQNGLQVLKELANIDSGLEAITRMLTPKKTAANH